MMKDRRNKRAKRSYELRERLTWSMTRKTPTPLLDVDPPLKRRLHRGWTNRSHSSPLNPHWRCSSRNYRLPSLDV